MCVEYCENFIQIGQKMKKLQLIQFEYLDVSILDRAGTYSREGKGWGNGVVYYLQTALPSVCGENAFTPLLFTPYFILFIHSAILHTQFIHTIYLVF